MPLLIVVSTAGWGLIYFKLLRLGADEDSGYDLFSTCLVGILTLSFIILGLNYFIPVGTEIGYATLTIGFLAYAIRLSKNRQWGEQTFLLLVMTALVSLLFRKLTYQDDTGLYHIPYMNWLAEYPVPLGLANVDGHLGFNSIWLVYIAAFRIDSFAEWHHVLNAEVAVRVLGCGWIFWKLLHSIRSGWLAQSYFYLSALIVYCLIVRQLADPGTDHAGNIFSLLAWIAYINCLFIQVRHEAGTIKLKQEFLLVLVLSTLAITSKLSLFPVVIIPLAFMLTQGLTGNWRVIRDTYRTGAVCTLFVIAWMLRGVLLSGCLLYPASFTCFDVAWRVPKASVTYMASEIMAWARTSGVGFQAYFDPWNFSWLGNWIGKFWRSPSIGVLEIMIALFVFTVVIKPNRLRWEVPDRKVVIPYVLVTVLIIACGLGLMFLKAPDPRFSWSFFAILGVAILYASVVHYSFLLPPVTWHKYSAVKVVLAGLILLSVIHIARVVRGVNYQPPTPKVIETSLKNGWKAFRPADGGSCWSFFPCAPGGIENVQVREADGRLLFVPRQSD